MSFWFQHKSEIQQSSSLYATHLMICPTFSSPIPITLNSLALKFILILFVDWQERSPPTLCECFSLALQVLTYTHMYTQFSGQTINPSSPTCSSYQWFDNLPYTSRLSVNWVCVISWAVLGLVLWQWQAALEFWGRCTMAGHTPSGKFGRNRFWGMGDTIMIYFFHSNNIIRFLLSILIIVSRYI